MMVSPFLRKSAVAMLSSLNLNLEIGFMETFHVKTSFLRPIFCKKAENKSDRMSFMNLFLCV